MRRKEDHQEDAMRSERKPCQRDHTLRKEILYIRKDEENPEVPKTVCIAQI